MNIQEYEKKFAIIYKGLFKDDEATLRKVKASFLTEFELQIPEILRILDSAPCVATTTKTYEEALRFIGFLSRAGADATIEPVESQLKNNIPVKEEPIKILEEKTEELETTDSEFVFETMDNDFKELIEPKISIQEPIEKSNFSFELRDEKEAQQNQVIQIPESAKIQEASPQINFTLVEYSADETIEKTTPISESNLQPSTELFLDDDSHVHQKDAFDTITHDLQDQRSQLDLHDPKIKQIAPEKLTIEPKTKIELPPPTIKTIIPELNTSFADTQETPIPPKDQTQFGEQVQNKHEEKNQETTTIQPLNTPQEKKKKNGDLISLLKILIPLVVIQTLITYAIYQSGLDQGREEAQDLSKMKNILPKVEKEDSTPPSDENIEEGESIVIDVAYKSDTNGSILDLNCKKTKVAFFSCTLSGTTVEPTALSPEQIVHNEKRAPWITKIETEDLTFNEKVAEGNARIYIDYNDNKDRVNAHVKITSNSDNDTLTVLITEGVDNPINENNHTIVSAKEEDKKYLISILQTFK